MFNFIKLLACICSLAQGCFVFPDQPPYACSFSPVMAVQPSTGFFINMDNCNALINIEQDFSEQPYLYWSDANESNFYTVIMVDPDAPYLVEGQSNLHWLVANVPGSFLLHGMGYNVGDILQPYEVPRPFPFTGEHHYMILIYEQAIDMVSLPIITKRYGFNLQDFFDAAGGDNTIHGPVASIGFVGDY